MSGRVLRALSRAVLNEEKKSVVVPRFPKNARRYTMCWRSAVGGWRLGVGGGWWWLPAVGGWGLEVDGGWQWLAVGGWSPWPVGGGWRLVAAGGWRLMVPWGGP